MTQPRSECRILFVETDEDRRQELSAALRSNRSSFRPDFVNSLKAAFAFIRQEAADVLFVNQEQCDTKAYDIAVGLRESRRRLPLVIMTPHVNDETVLGALRDGALECVSADPAAFSTYPAAAERAIARFEAADEGEAGARQSLRRIKQWMSIIDAITDYIYVLDSDRVLVKVNNTFAAAVGRHPRDIVGSRIEDVFDSEIPFDATLRTVLSEETPRIYEKKIGDELYQISIFPFRDEGRPLTIHVMKNISEVRRLKDQLYHSDKLASIGQLVSGVAHEINNPLTGTIAYTELLSMKTTDEAVKAELRKILDSAERCKKIVDNLLTFSRQRTPTKSLESVNDIIDRAIDLRSYWLRSYNIRIERDFDASSTVFVDAQQIQQVVLNLLLNAEQALVDAGRTDGRIVFTTRFDKTGRRIVIRVSDNGPGIPQKTASKIFDPFFTTKPVGIGTGLGLSISHGIITEHGGTIRFENQEGGGASFTIELPTGTPTGPPQI